jgi:hypothetical protein
MTMSSAFVRNGRTDVVASNPLARALLAPMFGSATVDKRGRPNIARHIFLDPCAHDFFVDWEPRSCRMARTQCSGLRAKRGPGQSCGRGLALDVDLRIDSGCPRHVASGAGAT